MDFFKNTTQDIMDWFDNNGEVNEVGFGDSNEFDISTITNFPYVFVIPQAILPQGATTKFTYQILVTDVLDATEEPIEALNRTADIIISYAKAKGVVVEIESLVNNTDVIYDQRSHRVFGWFFNYDITVKTLHEGC